MNKKPYTKGQNSPFVLSGSSPPKEVNFKPTGEEIPSLCDENRDDIQPTSKEFFDKKIVELPTQNRWFSTKEAAEYLRIPVGTLRNMTSNGGVPHYKLGRLNRYLEFDLKKLLLSNRRGV